jgi:hypothetical protein
MLYLRGSQWTKDHERRYKERRDADSCHYGCKVFSNKSHVAAPASMGDAQVGFSSMPQHSVSWHAKEAA